MDLSIRSIVVPTKLRHNNDDNKCLQEVCAVFSYWEKYHHLWRQDKDTTIKHFLTTSPTLSDYDHKIQSYIKLNKKLAAEPSVYRIGALQIKTGEGNVR